MNLQGLAIGLASFLTIGAFHPLVIKVDSTSASRFGSVSLQAGVVFSLLSLLVSSMLLSSLFGVVAFSSFGAFWRSSTNIVVLSVVGFLLVQSLERKHWR